ncbi:energy transducer TonB [Xanthobacter sp. V4C-4]|uniref:cell envelope integrity protein TolA n=1 Tax=Xanthobacter cornucopiae TaxID=3119924 RepID=UPI00372AD4B9
MSALHWHDLDRHHLRESALRFAAAGVFIVLLHTAFVYAALFWRKIEAAAAPPAAVMIELAPMPVSAPSQTEDVAPGPEMMQSPETTPDAPDALEEAPPPPDPIKQEVVEKVPELPPSPAPSEVVLPKPEPEVKPVEKPKPKPVEKPKKEAKPTRRKQAPVTSAAPRSDAAPSQSTAAPSPGMEASNSQARASWAAMISAHLNRFKRYPPGSEGVTGRPSVRFSLDGSGRVTSVSLIRSSGSEVLDGEAMATVRRASPFPSPPDGRGASFSVPVNFTRR